jgi:hypothetical protein
MINQDIYEITFILNIAIRILMVLLVFFLIIVVAAVTWQKKLEYNESKSFSISFIIYLILVMFSFIVGILFMESNNSFANILLSFSLEIYLFHKKSKWKFGILASVLLFISIIIKIASIFLIYFMYYSLAYFITNSVFTILINLNNLIIGIAILHLLRKTTDENISLKTYTKPISIGVVFIFIIKSLIAIISTILILIYVLGPYDDYFEIYYWFSYGINWLSIFIFLIGLIFLSIGAIKTMSVPLIFSKKRGVKEILPKSVNFCSECGTSLPADAKFCTNCGIKKQ